MFNKVILVGNLTKDIELKHLQSGIAVGKSGIAVNRKYKENGEQKEEVLFIDVVFWGKTAEIANQYLKKGSKLLVEGKLKFEQWEKEGKKQSKHSITVEGLEMLGSKDDESSGNYQPQNHTSSSHKKDISEAPNEDDIPF